LCSSIEWLVHATMEMSIQVNLPHFQILSKSSRLTPAFIAIKNSFAKSS